jgi:hypothetical protein
MFFLKIGSEKFKMAVAKTGCTCISVSTEDSETIPTFTCTFLGSGNSVALSRRLHLEAGSQLFKMASPNWMYLYLSF